jgi:hypothetical protein
VNVYVTTAAGSFAVDIETGDIEPWPETLPAADAPALNLPRVVAAAAAGSTLAAVVAAKPPLLVSYDAGATWRESGRGLPAGRAVAIAGDDPDLLVYAARNRLYVSRNGGVFWTALAAELPEIERIAF